MKIRYHFLLLLLFFTSFAAGQENISIKKKEFKTVKPGFKVAWKHVKDGDKHYSDGGIFYKDALNEYLKAYDYNNSNDALNYKIGICYLFSDSKEKAYSYLIKSFNINNNVSADILFLSAMAYQYAGKYNEAIEKYQAFLAGAGKKSETLVARAGKRIDECKSALILTKDTLRVEIKNAGKSINSGADEYSEIVTSDGKKIYFASRKALVSNEKNTQIDNKPDENIYSSVNIDGIWSDAVVEGKSIMTDFSETPLFIDKSGEVLYVYVGYEGNGDIKFTELRKGEWRSLKEVPFGINTNDPETSFCFSPSGDEIAFVSNRGTAGFGGKDIFFIKRNGKKWSKPVNAGDSINSIYNEESVRYSLTGDTLWFSSAGHNTIGGFDIFYSIKKGDVWGPAINAGYPVNTPWNDLFYLPSPVKSGAFYFVSDRSNGFGGLDIYSGEMNPVSKNTVPSSIGQKQVTDSTVVKDTSLTEKVTVEKQAQVAGINEISNISVSGISSQETTSNVAGSVSAGTTAKGRKARNRKE